MDRILLLMADPGLRRQAREALRRGCEVMEGTPPGTPGCPVDLIITDIPSLARNRQTLAAMRAVSRPASVPILAAALPEEVQRLSAKSWQLVDEVICLPLVKMELLTRVRTLLHQGRLTKRCAAQQQELQAHLETCRTHEAQLTAQKAELQRLLVDLEAEKQESQRVAAVERDLRARLTNILESVSDGFFSLDHDAVVTYFNRAAEKLLGRRAEEVTGRHIFDAFPEARGTIFEANYARAMRENVPVTFEVYFDQEPYANWYEVRTSPLAEGIAVYFRVTTERRKREEALRESERRFRQLVDSIPQLVWTCQPEGPCDFLSRQWLDYTGIPESEQLGYGWLNQIHPDDREGLLQTWNTAVATGIDFQVEFRIRRFDGTYKWFDTRAVPWTDADGRIIKWFGSNTDITERKQAEAVLRDSEARYRSLFENHHAVMLLVDPRTGAIVDANPAACAFYGYRREDLQRLQITALNTLEAADVQREMTHAQKQERQHFFFQHRLSNGTFRDVEVISGPIRFHDRELLYSIVHDITERRRAEESLRHAHAELEERVAERTAELVAMNELLRREIEASRAAKDKLRQSEARFAAFMEHLPGSAVMRDLDGRYIFVNSAWEQVTRKNKADILEKTLMEIWPEDIAGSLADFDTQVVASRQPMEAVELIEIEGETRYLLTHRFPILDARGEPFLVGVIAIDVTDRQQAEEKLRQSEALFAAFMDHLPGLAVMRDLDGRYLYVNEAWGRLTGIAPCHAIGKHTRDLWEPETAAKMLTSDQQVITSQRASEIIEELDLQDGVHYMLTHRFPILDREGTPLMMGAITIDVTRRKLAEDALRAERKRFLSLLQELPAYVYLMDHHNSLIFTNRAFKEEFGEPGGRRCYEIFKGRITPCTACPARRVFETREPAIWESVTPDGQIYQIYDYPFADVDGTPLVLGMGIDITARKRMEEALAKQAALLHDLYHNAPCGYHSLDSNGTFMQINDTELNWLGYAREEVEGRMKFSDLLTPESLQIFQENFPLFKARGWVTDLEFDLVRKDGSLLPVLLSATAIKDESGAFLMSRSTLYDITERQRAEKNLQRQSAVLEGINRILREALTSRSEAELARIFLETAEEVTDSAGGFVDLLKAEGTLDFLACSDLGWGTCRLPPESGETLPQMQVRGLYRRIVEAGQPLISNAPAVHPDYRGGPAGPPPLTAFLGMPLWRAGEVIGLVGLANRLGGYDDTHLRDVEALSLAFVEALNRKRMEAELRRAYDTMEKRVRERTRELSAANLALHAGLAEQQRAETKIKASLKEKEVLLQEIHHRTKNNMQVVCALLQLQAANFTDRQILQVFQETENRIRSMALVHEKLYQSRDLANIDLGDYLHDLAKNLMKTYQVTQDRIVLSVRSQPLPVSIETAIPCGLIVNELISNALKHAFPGERRGVITLAVRQKTSGEIELTVADNGAGMPSGLDFRRSESLGFQIVANLAEVQLKGELRLETSTGTAFHLRFREPQYGGGI